MQENRRVDAADVGGHLWETWERAEEGHDSDTGTMDPDPEVDPHLESAAGGATGLPGAAHADHDARAGALDYAHNSMADRDPSMPDAAPAPDMPSAGLDTAADEGLIYEQDGVVFDLGAAQDCLRATRETLNMFREDRVDRIGSRSRSRSRHATHDSDGRQGPHALQRRRPNHPTPNLPGWVCHLALRLAALANYAICPFFTGVFHVSKILWTAPGPLTTGPMVIHHRPPRLAPAEIQVWAPQAEAESLHSRWVLSGLKRSRRPAIRCTVVRSLPPADSRLHENVAVSQDFHLAHLPWARNTPPADDHPCRYAGPTVADRLCWQVGPRLHDTYQKSKLHLVWISDCCLQLATSRHLFLDSLARHNGTRRWKLAMAAASAHLLLTMQLAFAYLCTAVRGSGHVSQGSCAFHTKSRPGPKSRGPSTMLCRALLLLLHSQSAVAVLRTEARVAALVTGAAEDASPRRSPDARASKPGDLPQVSRLSQHGLVNRSVKRAYLRACRRALQQGHTRYRGRTLTAQEVPPQSACMEPHRIIPRPACQAAAQAQRGLHIFCWNSGGLGGGLYPELLTYLTESATDVAIILETKWQENMEFTTGPWTCIHGGCKSRKEAGILILVRQSLVPASRYDVNTCCKAGWLMCASRSEAPKPDTCMS